MNQAQLNDEQVPASSINGVNFNNLVRAIRQILSTRYDQRYFNSINNGTSTTISLIPSAVAADAKIMSLGVTLSGSTASVLQGYIQMGDVNYEITAGNVTLTGGTEYVYAFHKKDHSSSGVGHSSSVPTSAGDTWKFMLVKCAGSGSAYSIVKTYHEGNIILATPTL